MKKATIQLEPLACPSCLQKISNAVKTVSGVQTETVNVLFNASKVKLEFDETKTTISDVENSINKMGYEVIKSSLK